MASQALYRRYRSQTFDELIGQEHVVQTLRNALAEGRIAHAYLFTGPRGVGKTSVARLLAKAVNCTAELPQRPCGVCQSCVEIAEGRAVDVIEMDAASHTSVEDAREIIERVQFRPTSGRYKVYVIDECHQLSSAAFNALLKTLEEPPGHALFILATTEAHKVPATILSRCQRFTFSRHTIASTVAHLQAIAAQEGFTLEAGSAEAIARAATGSLRDALSVLDQLMAYGGSTIRLEQVQSLIGATGSQDVSALTHTLVAGDVGAALRVLAGVAEQGADLRQFVRDLVERLRALMLLKASGDHSLLDTTDDDLAQLEAQAASAELGALLQWVKSFSTIDTQIRNAAIPQLPIEMAIVEALTSDHRSTTSDQRPTARPAASKPASGKPGDRETARRETRDPRPETQDPRPERGSQEPGISVQPQDIAHQRPDIAAQQPNTQHPTPDTQHPTPDTQPSTTNTEPPPPRAARLSEDDAAIARANAAAAALEQIDTIWPRVVRDIKARNSMIQALLNSGVRPIDVQDTVVILEVDNEFLLGRLDPPATRQVIEQVLSKHLGANFGIRCVVKEQRRDNPNQLREQIRSARKDPLVKAAINIFDADIIAVERDGQGDAS